MSPVPPVLLEPVRLNRIGAGLDWELTPDQAQRQAVARWLGILDLPAMQASVALKPSAQGWRLSGRITGRAVQACGLTLEPVEEALDEAFGLDLVEASPGQTEGVVEVSLDDDSPDPVFEGRIDVSRYVLEHLALTLDPFPRKPGAVFEPPAAEAEISPFAVLRTRIKPGDEPG